MKFRAALLFLLAVGSAHAQSPGTVNLVGPSTSPGAPQVTPAIINSAVNAAMGAKADYPVQPGAIAQGGATTGQAIIWSGTAWAPATISGGGGSPGGTTGQIQVNSSGSFGGLGTTGTGSVVLVASPTISSPTLIGTTATSTLTVATSVNGWVPSFGVNAESVGTPAAGGTGYAAGDNIVFNDSCSTHATATVFSVSSGAITGATLITPGVCTRGAPATLGILSTSGSGTGATFPVTYSPRASYMLFQPNTGGGQNMILGNTMTTNFAGSETTIVGVKAGGLVADGSFTSIFGAGSCYGTTSVVLQNDTCVGADAGRNIVTGSANNVLVGAGTARDMAGSFSTIIGSGAGFACVGCSQDVIIGDGNSAVSTTGSIIIGYGADVTVGTASNTVIIGGTSNGGGNGAQGGPSSVIIGTSAGNPLLTGANNTIIGTAVGGTTCRSSINVILIGTTSNTDCASNAESFAIHIGAGNADVIYVTGTNSATASVTRISGNMSVGSTTLYKGAVNVIPLTGDTVTYAATERLKLINPAGTLANLTVQLPVCTTGQDGDERMFVSTQIVTTLVVSTTGGTLSTTPTSLTVGAGHLFHCLGSNGTWYQFL